MVIGLAGKVRYVVDPANPYPKAYTGHVKMTLKDGRVFEERQPHIRGGVHAPLSRQDIEQNFRGHVAFGGWSEQQAAQYLQYAQRMFDGPLDLSCCRR